MFASFFASDVNAMCKSDGSNTCYNLPSYLVGYTACYYSCAIYGWTCQEAGWCCNADPGNPGWIEQNYNCLPPVSRSYILHSENFI